jgi:aryl-alcohol dehydrogenase-like predicted oxidoreductase
VETRRLGSTGIDVSAITLGTAELGLDYGFRGSNHYRRPETADAVRIVRTAVDRGVTLIDTAPGYGDAERIVGMAIAGLAVKPTIATKVSIPDGPDVATAVTASVENSLRALRVDRIDLLQIHNATVDVLDRESTGEAMEALRRAGKIRFAAASVYGLAASLRAIALPWVRSVQGPYNLLDQGLGGTVFFEAARTGCGVLTRSAFLRGVLTSRIHETPAELAELREGALRALEEAAVPVHDAARFALRFCLSDPSVSSVIAGVRSEGELEESLAAAESGPLETGLAEAMRRYSMSGHPLVSPLAWSGLI